MIHRTSSLLSRFYTFFTFFIGCWANSFAQIVPVETLSPIHVEYGSYADSLFDKHWYEEYGAYPIVHFYQAMDASFKVERYRIDARISYHNRFKVLKEEGLRASLVRIPYYFDSKIEALDHVEAQTVDSLGNVTKLDTLEIRTININSRYNIKEFVVPDVKVGSIVEYRYELTRRFIEELPDFYLQEQQPVLHSYIRLENSQYLTYEALPVNLTFQVKNKISRVDTSSAPKVFTQPRVKLIVEEWYAHNVPAFDPEPLLSSPNDYRGRIIFRWREFGNPRQILENSWAYVAAESVKRFGYFDHEDEAFFRVLPSPPPLYSDRAKLRFYVEELRRRALFNESRGSASGLKAPQVWKGDPASQPDMNQFLLHWLRSDGYEAYPVLIASRERGRLIKKSPSLFPFDALVVGVVDRGDTLLIDASYSGAEPDLVPPNLANREGFLIKHDGFEWVRTLSDNTIFQVVGDIRLKNEGRSLLGLFNGDLRGYAAQSLRQARGDTLMMELALRETLLDAHQQLDISIKNIRFQYDLVHVEFEFAIYDYLIEFSDALDFFPLPIGYQLGQPLEEEKRRFPVVLDYPQRWRLNYDFEMPSGFSFPKKSETLSNNFGGNGLALKVDSDARHLVYSFVLNLEEWEYPTRAYGGLRQILQQWTDLSQSRWQLKKKK